MSKRKSATKIESVTYLRDNEDPHPFLESGTKMDLVAYPDLLVLRKQGSTESLLDVSWNSVTNIKAGRLGKSGGQKILVEGANLFGPFMRHTHDGVWVVYEDAIVDKSIYLFFRTRGQRQAENLSKKLWKWVYDYKKRLGKV